MGMVSFPNWLAPPSRHRGGAGIAALAAATAAALALVAPAAARPISPTLTVTTPESPGLSTTPRILGRAGGVGTSVVSRAFRPVGTAAVEPSSPITVYADPGCSGPVVATGTLGELEGAGIEVTVTPGSTTSFYATLSDPSEPEAERTSLCSSPGLTYRQVTGPPPAPLLTGVNPASPADQNSPRVLGSAEDGTSVAIYADSACATPPLAGGSAKALASPGVAVPVADNSTTTFYATASWAGLLSPCSTTSVSFQEVTVAPPAGGGPGTEAPGGSDGGLPAPTPGRPAPPKLHTVPGARANDNTPRVVGSASGAVRAVIYAGDGCSGPPVATGSLAELAAGLPVRVAANSTTGFYGLVVDSDGGRSRCTPEPVLYVEDSAPPLTRITFGPGVKTRKRAPVFRFADITGDPPGTTFACQLDRRPWRVCRSPWRLYRVGVKAHVVRIRAVDAAGNQEPAPTKRRFKVIARPGR
jgi:hypothetical protein